MEHGGVPSFLVVAALSVVAVFFGFASERIVVGGDLVQGLLHALERFKTWRDGDTLELFNDEIGIIPVGRGEMPVPFLCFSRAPSPGSACLTASWKLNFAMIVSPA